LARLLCALPLGSGARGYFGLTSFSKLRKWAGRLNCTFVNVRRHPALLQRLAQLGAEEAAGRIAGDA